MTIFYYQPFLYLSFGLLLLVSKPTLAEESEDLAPAPVPPPLPEQPEAIGPEIKIIQEGKVVIEEYRLNGKLYKIKVTPLIGPSYYLVDIDGNGDFEKRFEGPDIVGSDMLIPSWVLFRF
jgi:hypothetical protein